MQLNKQSTGSRKKHLYIVGGVLAFLLFALVSYFVFQHFYRQSNPNSAQPDTATTDSPATKQQNSSTKDDFINNVKLPSQDTDAAEQPPKDQSSSISIDLSQQDGDIVVSTKLPGFSDGSCKVTATNGAKSYSDSTDVLYQPSYSTCMGFNIPISQLGAGTWTVSLQAKGSTATATKTSTIKVTQ